MNCSKYFVIGILIYVGFAVAYIVGTFFFSGFMYSLLRGLS